MLKNKVQDIFNQSFGAFVSESRCLIAWLLFKHSSLRVPQIASFPENLKQD